MYLLCRAFKKLPSEVDDEYVFYVQFLLEGLEKEKKIQKRRMDEAKAEMR